MSFVDICWLLVKIMACIIAVFLALGFTAKAIKSRRDKKFQSATPSPHKLTYEDFEEDN